MTAETRKILEKALSLPETDRQWLVEALLDSLPADAAEALEKAWDAEAVRRAEALERGEVETIAGDAAMAELRSKFAAADKA